MNKSESKYFNTAIRMDEALLELLEKKDMQYITIKEICDTARVNRSTFYLHYENITDLLEETLEYVSDKIISAYDTNPGNFIKNIDDAPLDDLIFINRKFLRPYLEFVRDNKKLFRAVVKNPKSLNTDGKYANISKYIINPVLKRFGIPDNELRFWVTYYINGVNAIIQEWIKNDCIETNNFIEEVIIKCVNPDNCQFEAGE